MSLFSSIFKSGIKNVKGAFTNIKSAYKTAMTEGGLKNRTKSISEGIKKVSSMSGSEFRQRLDNTVLGKTINLGSKVSNAAGRSGPGRAAKFIGKTGRSAFGKIPVTKIAVPVMFAGGVAYGGASASMDRLNQRSANTMSGAGMNPNNLGTDGLTLALSRRRHR